MRTVAAAAMLGCLLLAVGPSAASANDAAAGRGEPSEKFSMPIKGGIPEEWKKGGNREFDVHFGQLTVGRTLGGTRYVGRD